MSCQSELDLKVISEYFTKEILCKVIQEYFNKKKGQPAPEINSYSVNYGSGKGDGYVGVVYKIQVNCNGVATVNLIAKGMPANVTRRKAFRCENFFANECLFYNTVVPAFQEFGKQQMGNNYKDSMLAIPDCYYALSNGVNDFIVLEDLGDEHYCPHERSLGVSSAQITEVFLTIARFHAFSLAMKHVCPEKFKEISDQTFETVFTRVDCMWTEKYVAKLAKNYMLAIEEELENTKYFERFVHFTKPENFYNTMFHTVETKPEKSVINHGDTWITNFMFRDAEIKVIDFQLIRYCSPILDLSTIVFACTDSVQREALGGIDGILSLYQRELNRVVTSLGAPEDAGMSLDEVRSAWRELGVHGFGYGAIELVQVSLIEEGDILDLDRFDGDQALTLVDVISIAEIKKPEGKKRLVDLLKCAVDEGLI